MKWWLLFFTLIFISGSCRKDSTSSCYALTGTGRIIGFDPCAYYENPDDVSGAGFVLEIDNGFSKDTFATYQVPNGLFDFPEIDYWESVNGAFLFPQELQDDYKIRFSYKTPTENEKVAYACLAIVNTGPFFAATKGRQLLLKCISKI